MTARLVRLGGQKVDLLRAKPAFSALNVRDYGAVGDGVTDDQSAIVTAIAAASAQSKPLWFPPGIYRHSARITVTSVTLFASPPVTAGVPSATLYGTTVDAHAIDLRGTGGLHNLGIRGPAQLPRSANRGGCGVYVLTSTGWTIRNCVISDVSSAGIMVEDGHTATITRCDLRRTGADGILITEGSSGIDVGYCRTRSTGDDAIAVTSYNSTLGYCSNIGIHHNSVLGNFESRAITVNGSSSGISIHDNHIDGGTAGITTCSSSAFGTLQTAGVEAYSNTIRNINQSRQDTGTIGGGALHLYNDLGGADTSISMHDNRIYNPGLHAAFVLGTGSITASITTNAWYLDGALTAYLRSGGGAGTITQTGTTSGLPGAYPGDLVAAGIGGIDPLYQYTP